MTQPLPKMSALASTLLAAALADVAAPLGAGRVEDTINLLGHAARNIVNVVSKITERTTEEICRKAGIPLLLAPSIKAGLDIDWSDPKQKATAIQIVERQVASLATWVERRTAASSWSLMTAGCSTSVIAWRN